MRHMASLTSSWTTGICGSPFCSKQGVASSCGWKDIFDSSTCTNHILETGIAALIIIILALQLLVGITKRGASARRLVALGLPLQLAGVVFNGCLGLIYLGLASWMLGRNLSQHASVHLPHWWITTLSQGFCLIIVSFTFSIRTHFLLGPISVRVWSVLLTTYAAYVCCSSVVHMVADKVLTMKAFLDVLFLPGALLLHVYGIWHIREEEDGNGGTESGLYKPLNTEAADDERADSQSHVTPFAKAGFFSVMSFWWLNPMMKMGYEKPLEEKNMPLLGPSDRAYSQYLIFLEKLNRKKQLQAHGTPSIFWTIISCQKSEILVSGLFALLKVLTLSSGPVLLKAFINVSLGKGSFKYEGYVLAVTLFICKCCESLSQRQWYFRTRRLGLQVRSFLSAAIYKKQQKLSNAAKLKHSSGEIMNYVTVDAYRIGEFPYWFHQTWTTCVQLCIALVILYNAVGLATIASLAVIIVTAACNALLAKLQHKFQSKLMETRTDSALSCRRHRLVRYHGDTERENREETHGTEETRSLPWRRARGRAVEEHGRERRHHREHGHDRTSHPFPCAMRMEAEQARKSAWTGCGDGSRGRRWRPRRGGDPHVG